MYNRIEICLFLPTNSHTYYSLSYICVYIITICFGILRPISKQTIDSKKKILKKKRNKKKKFDDQDNLSKILRGKDRIYMILV